jgi:hypothetical protein
MNFDKIELGTPETAVKSCVNLLSRLFEQPEDYVACYLDLYYQVRRRWEESETPSGAARQLPHGGSQGERVPPSMREGDREAVEGAPTGTAETPSGAARQLPRGGSQETKKKRDPASYANTVAHDAAVYKRGVRERFMAARAKGLSLPELIRASEGNVTEGDLWKVINAHNLGIQHYRDIDAALDRLSL